MPGLTIQTYILRAEGWQIFSVFMAVMLLCAVTPDDHELLKIFVTILYGTSLFGWLFVTGRSLNDHLPEDQQKPETLFTISFFYCIAYLCISATLKNTFIETDIAEYIIISVIIFCFAFLYMLYFASTLFILNQDVLPEREKLNYKAVFVLFIIFVIGVLVLQSRIKKILQ